MSSGISAIFTPAALSASFFSFELPFPLSDIIAPAWPSVTSDFIVSAKVPEMNATTGFLNLVSLIFCASS